MAQAQQVKDSEQYKSIYERLNKDNKSEKVLHM